MGDTDLSTPASETGVIRRGIFTIYPDGTMFPPISGGMADEPPADPPAPQDPPPADPQPTEPAPPKPAPQPAPEPAPSTDPTRLPDDHPLVKAYNAEKEKNKRIKSWLSGGDDADPTKSPEERYADAVKRAEIAERELMKRDIAAELELTPAQAKFLTGDTEEDLRASAAALKEAFAAAAPATPPSPKPSPAPRARGGTDPTGAEVDVKSLLDSIPPTA